MARTRPLSDLPKVIGDLREAAAGMPSSVVPVIAKNVTAEVSKQAKPFGLRGRNGQRVPLQATFKIGGQGYASVNGKAVAVVSGKPIGFWHIVEGGSQPHLITTLGLRTGRRGRLVNRRVMNTYAEGGAIRGKPLHIPGIGFRQFAVHPGHAPIGKPWAKSMSNANDIVSRSLSEHAKTDFMKAWGG